MLGHSEEIAEFLALGGDAHIEFVKKRTDIAPKIDQVGEKMIDINVTHKLRETVLNVL